MNKDKKNLSNNEERGRRNMMMRLLTAAFFILHASYFISPAMAADYVDAINSATAKYEAGHQVIYEMNVGSFTTEGTFAAAQQRLGELKALGVDIVWLMPIYPRGGGINSPYAATDFQQTNPNYGTIADLKALVNAAHTLNMEVWLDWVPNHTATDAKWVTEHPEYYKKNGDRFVHPNNYGDVYQLDYGNADLRQAMNDCLKFWIDEADVDGYRCDYISSPEIPASYWQATIPDMKGYKSGKTITFLGETDIAQDVTRLKAVGFDYDYAWAFQSSLDRYGSSGVYAASLKANADKMLTASDGISFGRMLYVTNHDRWESSPQLLHRHQDQLDSERRQDVQHHPHADGPQACRSRFARQDSRQLGDPQSCQQQCPGLYPQGRRQRDISRAEYGYGSLYCNTNRTDCRRLEPLAEQRDHRSGHKPTAADLLGHTDHQP